MSARWSMSKADLEAIVSLSTSLGEVVAQRDEARAERDLARRTLADEIQRRCDAQAEAAQWKAIAEERGPVSGENPKP